MSRSVSRSAIKLLVAIVVLLLVAAALAVRGIAICPFDGIRSAFTGNTKPEHIPFNPKPRMKCEYHHPAQGKYPAHTFYADCQ